MIKERVELLVKIIIGVLVVGSLILIAVSLNRIADKSTKDDLFVSQATTAINTNIQNVNALVEATNALNKRLTDLEGKK